MNQLRDSYSNATSSNSSFSESSGGPSTPRTSPDGSNIHHRTTVRASVFDAFYQLGGFEENSQLAEWMFNEGGSIPSEISSSNGPSIRFREQSGSRFRERLGSDSPMFILNNWRDDETIKGNRAKKDRSRSKAPPPSKAGSTANKKQNANRISIAPSSHQTRRPFSLFRNRNTPSEKLSGVFEDTKDPVEVSSTPPKSKRKPPMLRSKTDPTSIPMPLDSPPYIDSNTTSPAGRPSLGDWEKLDPLSTVDFQTLASTENPFLHGSQRPGEIHTRPHTADGTPVPFPTSSQEWAESSSGSPTFMQRLSLIVTKPFRNSHIDPDLDSPSRARSAARFSLRRTKSNTQDTTARPFFISTPPPTARMHRLKPSISHS
ncbi:hypothetical protein PM082_020324 [Marasmius tenuissimus]|nr:hypothetical protein PM082_020324 [Marasmius tenuissimus]